MEDDDPIDVVISACGGMTVPTDDLVQVMQHRSAIELYRRQGIL
jgi:hypothetical protein